jgi:hypothetical protein
MASPATSPKAGPPSAEESRSRCSVIRSASRRTTMGCPTVLGRSRGHVSAKRVEQVGATGPISGVDTANTALRRAEGAGTVGGVRGAAIRLSVAVSIPRNRLLIRDRRRLRDNQCGVSPPNPCVVIPFGQDCLCAQKVDGSCACFVPVCLGGDICRDDSECGPGFGCTPCCGNTCAALCGTQFDQQLLKRPRPRSWAAG